jgi:hypothetical protein
MKASEILHGLAELMAGIESGHGQEIQPNHAELSPVEVDHTDHSESTGVFIPPLQAKLELLKKSVGVDSAYDDGQEGEGDELSRMKHMAGINTITIDAAGDDEPLDI